MLHYLHNGDFFSCKSVEFVHKFIYFGAVVDFYLLYPLQASSTFLKSMTILPTENSCSVELHFFLYKFFAVFQFKASALGTGIINARLKPVDKIF